MNQERKNVSIGDEEIARRNEILRTRAGSEVFGMALPGTSDQDEMGVYVETQEQLLGLAPSSEHYTFRTQPEGMRSGPGDTDLTLYSLRKYMRLACAGNPTVLTPLFVEPQHVLSGTVVGGALRNLAPFIVSRRAGWRFLGYLESQRERMVGGGRQSRVPKRPELIEKHGYDTKYASHALRLGLQGIQLVSRGYLPLPMDEEFLETCMEVKRGEVDFTEALRRVDVARERLRECIENGTSPLPPQPNMQYINAWMVQAHKEHWRVERMARYMKADSTYQSILFREAAATTRLDRDETFSLGPQ